jgi:hypothetical protein
MGEWLGTVRTGFRNYNKQMQRGRRGTDRAGVRGRGDDGRKTRTRTTRTTARSNDKGSASRDEGGARRHGGSDGCVVKADGLRGSEPAWTRSRANVSRSSGWEMESGEAQRQRSRRSPLRPATCAHAREHRCAYTCAHAHGCARAHTCGYARVCARADVAARPRAPACRPVSSPPERARPRRGVPGPCDPATPSRCGKLYMKRPG